MLHTRSDEKGTQRKRYYNQQNKHTAEDFSLCTEQRVLQKPPTQNFFIVSALLLLSIYPGPVFSDRGGFTRAAFGVVVFALATSAGQGNSAHNKKLHSEIKLVLWLHSSAAVCACASAAEHYSSRTGACSPVEHANASGGTTSGGGEVTKYFVRPVCKNEIHREHVLREWIFPHRNQ